MVSCKEYATAVSSGELERAGLSKRLSMALHWLICKYCRAYARQMRRLGDAARHLFGKTPPNPEALERLEEELAERCRRPD